MGVGMDESIPVVIVGVVANGTLGEGTSLELVTDEKIPSVCIPKMTDRLLWS